MPSDNDVPVQPPIDPFDLEALRALPNLEDSLVERVLLAVPARKPRRTEFFRVHPKPEYTVDAFVLEHEEGMDRTTYWVDPTLRGQLADELQPTRLFTCVTKHGTVFLWPAKLPTEDRNSGRPWRVSALEIAEEAKTSWVRMRGNKDLGAYELFRAKGDLGEPAWPDKTFRELVGLAFKENLIDSLDHPVIREINGLI